MGLRRGGAGRRGAAPAASAEANVGPRAGRMRGAAGTGTGPTIYKMRQRMVAIGDDFWIETQDGRRAFKVDGKALRLRDTLRVDDANGVELYRIQARVLRVRDAMEIERSGGGTAAKVLNALVTPLRDRWTINVPREADYRAQGNILQHEYRIERNGARVAEVSKKWFRIRDSYGIEIQPGQDDALILMITVCIDMMAHEGR